MENPTIKAKREKKGGKGQSHGGTGRARPLAVRPSRHGDGLGLRSARLRRGHQRATGLYWHRSGTGHGGGTRYDPSRE